MQWLEQKFDERLGVAVPPGHRFLEKLGKALKARIANVILAAPDIDSVEFQPLALRILNGTQARVTLYASSRDLAMQAANKIYSNYVRAGYVAPEGPTVLKGMDSIDASAVSTAFLSPGHAEYAESGQLLADISVLVFKARERIDPFVRRLPEGGTRDGIKYWKFP